MARGGAEPVHHPPAGDEAMRARIAQSGSDTRGVRQHCLRDPEPHAEFGHVLGRLWSAEEKALRTRARAQLQFSELLLGLDAFDGA